MKGKIILIHFPFTDLSAAKMRPALVIHESDKDVVVAFISSKVTKYILDSDLLIPTTHPSFSGTGLKVPSVIKFDKVATIAKDLIEGEIGTIDSQLEEECNIIIRRIFSF